MKFYSLEKLLQILLVFTYMTAFVLTVTLRETNNQDSPKTKPNAPENPSDAVHKRILDYINQLAEDKMKSSNMMAKKKSLEPSPKVSRKKQSKEL